MTNGSLSQKWGKLTQSPKNTWTTYPIVLSQKFSSPTWATAHFFFLHRHAHPSWSQSHGQKWKARVQLLFHLWLKYFLGDLQNSPCKNVLKSESKTKCCFISGSTFHLFALKWSKTYCVFISGSNIFGKSSKQSM